MPVTVRLSPLFSERVGDEVATELVTWCNAVDASYHADPREFNQLNFARFDARLEQRLAELRVGLLAEIAGVRAERRAELAELRAERRGRLPVCELR